MYTVCQDPLRHTHATTAVGGHSPILQLGYGGFSTIMTSVFPLVVLGGTGSADLVG
jgi:hypothetical protein